MKCKNIITIARYNNGKNQVMGSAETVKDRLSPSINGHYATEKCDGKIVPDIFISDSEFGGAEISIIITCSKCGKIYHDIKPDDDMIKRWIVDGFNRDNPD